MMVIPETITIMTSCANFSLLQKVGAGVGNGAAIVGTAVGWGVWVGALPVNSKRSSSFRWGGRVGIGVRIGVGVRAFPVTITVYVQ